MGQFFSVNFEFLLRLEACATRFPIVFLFNKACFYWVIYKVIHFFPLKSLAVADYSIIIFIQPHSW